MMAMAVFNGRTAYACQRFLSVMVNHLGNKNGLTLVRSMTMSLNIFKETNNYD